MKRVVVMTTYHMHVRGVAVYTHCGYQARSASSLKTWEWPEPRIGR